MMARVPIAVDDLTRLRDALIELGDAIVKLRPHMDAVSEFCDVGTLEESYENIADRFKEVADVFARTAPGELGALTDA
jgi:hypothetical protein